MKIDFKTKFFYGMGFISVELKTFCMLFLFSFTLVKFLGWIKFTLESVNLIALLFDAISDPIIGTISDNYKSKKYGRRHPFMAISAIPLGLSTYLLFTPLDNLSQFELFLWMTFFSILIRFFSFNFFGSWYVTRS